MSLSNKAISSQKPKLASAAGIDMLNGGLFGKLLLFSLPLIASGMLQQSFNAVDIAVVGRFASPQAMAAVGGNNIVINIMINLFIGLSVGANVVIANHIGRGNLDAVRRATSTVALLAVGSGVFLLFAGLLFSETILEAISTPDDVIDLASLYLRIFFLGMPFIMIFNFGSAILRSIGDTRRPFYMLIVSGLVNTVLNLILVIGFDMGVAGVGIATVVSHGVNAALMIRVLVREKGACRLDFRSLTIDRSQLGRILRIGVPAGLQGMIFSFSNIFVQSGINSFGSAAVAGSAAALNFESYSYFIISSFAQAAVAFTSQNYGAGNAGRCRAVFSRAMALALAICITVDLAVLFWREPLVGIFSTDQAVTDFALERLKWVFMLQFIACSYEVAGGSLRGLGHSMLPTLITVGGTCVLRLVWIFTVFASAHTFGSLLVVYPISWCVTGVAMLGAWAIVSRRAFASLAATPECRSEEAGALAGA